MKISNKNQIHLAPRISAEQSRIDQDRHYVYGQVRTVRQGNRSWKRREIEYVYGVNKMIRHVNQGYSDVDSCARYIHGYDNEEI